jgi:ribosome-binding factor A
MLSYRRERAGDFIREQFTLLLRDQIHDPRVQNIIITDVNLTQDRRLARVYVACYDGEEALHKGLEGLESAKPFFRRALSQSLEWRFAPAIEFRVDRSFQYGTRIDALLRELKEDDSAQQEEPEEDGEAGTP